MAEKKKKKEERPPKNFIRYSGMAMQMAAVILAGVFGGIKLDEYLELESPAFTITFSLLAVFVSMYLVIKDLSK